MNRITFFAWLDATAAAFVGGGLAWASTHVEGVPTSSAAWKVTAGGFAFAGATALWQRYKQSPKDLTTTTTTATLTTVAPAEKEPPT